MSKLLFSNQWNQLVTTGCQLLKKKSSLKDLLKPYNREQPPPPPPPPKKGRNTSHDFCPDLQSEGGNVNFGYTELTDLTENNNLLALDYEYVQLEDIKHLNIGCQGGYQTATYFELILKHGWIFICHASLNNETCFFWLCCVRNNLKSLLVCDPHSLSVWCQVFPLNRL